eukprot:5346690-Pleurochrysis_carterae.AAC.1
MLRGPHDLSCRDVVEIAGPGRGGRDESGARAGESACDTQRERGRERVRSAVHARASARARACACACECECIHARAHTTCMRTRLAR